MRFEAQINETITRRCRITVEAEDSDHAYDIVYDNYLSGKYEKRMKPDDGHIDDIEIQLYEEFH